MTLKEGRYKLDAPLANPAKDGRVRYDWRLLREFPRGFYLIKTNEDFLYKSLMAWYDPEKDGDRETYEKKAREKASQNARWMIQREHTYQEMMEPTKGDSPRCVEAWNALMAALQPAEVLPTTAREWMESRGADLADLERVIDDMLRRGKIKIRDLDAYWRRGE